MAVQISVQVRKKVNKFTKWFFSDWKPLELDGCKVPVIMWYGTKWFELQISRHLAPDFPSQQLMKEINISFAKSMMYALDAEIMKAIEGEATAELKGLEFTQR